MTNSKKSLMMLLTGNKDSSSERSTAGAVLSILKSIMSADKVKSAKKEFDADIDI